MVRTVHELNASSKWPRGWIGLIRRCAAGAQAAEQNNKTENTSLHHNNK
jgi:hypothetical protein